MAVCELLDIRCMIVSELVGSVILSILLGAVFYFIIAAKLRWGFDTTIVLAFPLLLIIGLTIAGFSIIYAFGTAIVGLLLAWIFQEIIRNR